MIVTPVFGKKSANTNSLARTYPLWPMSRRRAHRAPWLQAANRPFTRAGRLDGLARLWCAELL